MELFDLYDVNRQPLNQTMVRGTKQPPNTYRLVVHVCVFSSDGKMLCQRRQPFKDGWSGMWDISVGGSVVAGETSVQGARRELMEELGLVLPQDARPSLTIHWEGGFDDYYCITMDVDESKCKLQYEEVAQAKYLSLEEIMSKIEDGSFIPYHKGLIEFLFFMQHSRSVHTRKDNSTKK